MPFAYVMGVEWNDAFKVGQLLGVKTFLNEFVAYQDLAKLIKNRKMGLDGPSISVSFVFVTLKITFLALLVMSCLLHDMSY